MLSRTFLDRLVGLVSPKAEMRRLQYRAASDVLLSHYNAGSTGRRSETWRASGVGPTAATTLSLATIRNRSRDLIRNDPWARNAIEDLETETIGTGIVPKIKAKSERKAKALSDRWKAWAESTECDSEGLHDFFGLQALAFRTMGESGEGLIRRRLRRESDGLAIPMQLQVIEPDHLDTSRDVVNPDGSRILGGIEFDRLGRRVAYWLFPEHPGENAGFLAVGASVRVPAESVIQLFRVERPGQVRGVPWGASAIMRIRDFGLYEDAQLLRQQIAACFSTFIHDAEPSSTPAVMAGVESESDKPPTERVYPGMIMRLEPGKEVTFASPPGVEGYDAYSTNVLRAIAAGFGTTYEALTGDYSKVNFSSARMGWIRHNRRVDAWRWRIVVPRLCDRVWSWAADLMELQGLPVEGSEVSWSPPRRDLLDPKTEITSTRTEIRAGLKSLQAAIRERGDEPDEVFAELEADRTKLDELGLIVESDARRPSNGQPGDPAAAAAGGAPGGTPAGESEDPEEPADEQPPEPASSSSSRRARRPRS